jgi:arylsulfatase A-like enzyme
MRLPEQLVSMPPQWHHAVDIAPTLLEAAGLPFPKVASSTRRKTFEGTNFMAKSSPVSADEKPVAHRGISVAQCTNVVFHREKARCTMRDWSLNALFLMS